MILRHPGTVAACVVLLAGMSGCRKKPAPATVTIQGRTWTVELAVTEAQRYRGLSYREHLPADAGMLFVFSEPEILTFCMRDCVIPLDIAFISSNLRVVNVATMRVEPDGAGRVPYPSDEPAQFVLEVPAGSLRGAGVKRGDRVYFSSNVPTQTKDTRAPGR